jgi:subtilase family serine protease
MKRFRKSGAIAFLRGLSAIMVISFFLPALAFGYKQTLTRHMHDEVSSKQATWVERLPAKQSMRLNIALPLRNEFELDELLKQIYDPHSPSYHKFLSVEEFTERFGPSQEDYDAVISFAKANGLIVTGTATNRMIVDVIGPVANIERAFHVNMGVYRHPTENRNFYSPDWEPTADIRGTLWHITGLDNFSIPHPASLKRNTIAKSNLTGSGPSGYFIGSDMRAAYYGGTALTGSGQSVGLVEFAGYNVNDVINYFNNVGQPLNVSIVGVSTDGSSLSCTGNCDDSEQVLDIEAVISMAPSMSQVLVYVSDTSDVSIFNRMATDNIAKSLACSWGWSPADPSSDDPIFKELAAQGQTLFIASSDSGAYRTKSKKVYPADDAYVTSVGGTNLTTASAGGPWESETAWSNSGGGISPNNIAIPSYQTTAGVITTANKGSRVYRNSPDVAAEANTDNYICYNGTCEGGWGGTSFAAPRWAGYLALVNQQSVANGHSAVGFINPIIYSIGLGTNYGNDFHDITSGNNGTYSTTVGYDLVTGWGSPNGVNLINLLAPSDKNLYASFTNAGIWQWDGNSWAQVTPNNPQLMVTSGSNLYGDFTGQGIWQWDRTNWTQITPNDPQLIVATSTILYGSFAGGGIWEWDGTNWTQTTPNNPLRMVASDSNLYGSFSGGGIWQWNGSTWTQITPNNPQLMVASDSNLYGAFAGGGIWQWNGSTWTQVTPNNPQLMVASNSSLYGAFVGGGIWQWNGSAWSQLTPNNPVSMVLSY